MLQRESQPRSSAGNRMAGLFGNTQIYQRELRPPEFDTEQMPNALAPRAPAPAPARREFTQEQVDECLQNFLADAKAERLECLAQAINTYCLVMTADRPKSKTLPGSLTVKGWIGLLNRWEPLVGQFRSRQVFFAKQFLQEALDNSDLRFSPMAGAFQELVILMEDALEVPVEHVVRNVG